MELADVDVLIFGPEFIGRLEEVAEDIMKNRLLLYVGEGVCPPFAESYNALTADCSSASPNIALTDDDYAAIYFSSGTTGFPLYPAPVPHRRKNALVRILPCGRKSRSA